MNIQVFRLSALACAAFVAACGNAPSIDELSPNKGTVGTQVTIKGTNFGAEQAAGGVEFGDVALAGDDLISWSNTEVVVKVPAALPPSEVRVRIRNDGGLTSNGKRFTVVKSDVKKGQIAVVANRKQPGFQVFWFGEATAGGFANPTTLFEIGVKEAGFETTIRGLASAPAQSKIYVAVDRVSTNGGDDRSDLLVFQRDAEGDITTPTRIDVGVLPAGMALSPNGDRLYVAAAASGMLTVVNTATNQVDEDITVDLFQQVSGFEPLNVVVLPSEKDGGHIVAVVGFNWTQPAGQVLTYAPLTTDSNRKFQGSITLPDLELNGAVAVSGETSKMWVLGSMRNGAGIAFVDPIAGTVAGPSLFGPTGVDAGFSSTIAAATDIYANGNHFYVAFPHNGVGAFGVPTDSTHIYNPDISKLIGFDGALKMAPLISGVNSLESLLVTRTEASGIARVKPGLGEVEINYMATETSPTLIHTFAASTTDGTL